MLGRVQSFASCLATKTNVWTAKSIYYGKVGIELSKQIYAKEGLQPPTVEQFKHVYSTLYKKAFQVGSKPNESIAFLRNLQKNDYIKYGALGVQLLGFYSVGEIVGRRNIVGYKNYSTASHSH